MRAMTREEKVMKVSLVKQLFEMLAECVDEESEEQDV